MKTKVTMQFYNQLNVSMGSSYIQGYDHAGQKEKCSISIYQWMRPPQPRKLLPAKLFNVRTENAKPKTGS